MYNLEEFLKSAQLEYQPGDEGRSPSGILLHRYYQKTYPEDLAQRVKIERDTMWKMVDVFTGDHPEIRRVPWYKILIEKIKAHV